MGITLCQYRAGNGGFLSKLYSSNWRPRSSGNAKIGVRTGSSLCGSRRANNLIGLMSILLRLIVVGIPILQCLRNEGYNFAGALQNVELKVADMNLVLLVSSLVDKAAVTQSGHDMAGPGINRWSIGRAYGDVSDNIGKKAETGMLAAIDPEDRVIGLRLYDSLFKVIPLEKDQAELKAYNISMEELQIYDIQSSHGVAQPTIVLLDFLRRHVKTHELSLNEKEFANDVWKQVNVEREASMIIPAPEPNGGVIIIGADGNIYHNGTMHPI